MKQTNSELKPFKYSLVHKIIQRFCPQGRVNVPHRHKRCTIDGWVIKINLKHIPFRAIIIQTQSRQNCWELLRNHEVNIPHPPPPLQINMLIATYSNIRMRTIIQQIYNMNILWFSDIKWQLAVWLSDQWSSRECEDACVLINKCRHALPIAKTCSCRNINSYFVTSKHLYKTIVMDITSQAFLFTWSPVVR